MRIRDIRKVKGKTLDEIAKDAKQTESAIWQFENGRSSISINYALFLRNEFGTSFDWIYDGEIIITAHKPKSSRCSVLDPVSIGLRLKDLREQFRLNKQEFGKSIGVTCQTIGQFEKGKMSPRIVIAREIKRRYHKPLDWIYFGDEIIVPKSAVRANAKQSSPEAKKKSRL
ncbi:Tyrosyl-tRNA synthetase, mitochondrial [Candidatus Liberibacter solanacearum]|uniref:Tyrosyl-tRNA synthetase, mitochondrial n=1 Tax=Candidatus Liberibacter solanacearum TaxID=556287 RepID=A0A0F4VJK4_9HYPH|nr:helix-turn-helix domain-containing protein [Candidatus Liberibacter solanacearum]KJZ81574.1 Tyrosyl-tRNA synthetase, mitochondrial [Candidatus Liberibacter solanacearum]